MKLSKILAIAAFIFLIIGIYNSAPAAELKDMIVSVKYFMFNNKIPFVQVNSKVKLEKKLYPVSGMAFSVYLDSAEDSLLIGKVKTNDAGDATIAIPAALKAQWDAAPKHTLICTSAATKEYNESEQEIEITQAKLLLDTTNDGEARSMVATLMEKTDNGWIPVKETDIKIGVKRLGGILTAGTDETYATDETGAATVVFERERLPGDKNGNLTLAAKLEDNDIYGNLVTEMNAKWGVKPVYNNDDFSNRSLWATRTKAPYWLLLLANSIIVVVWGVIIYLAFQIVKIKKIGTKVNV